MDVEVDTRDLDQTAVIIGVFFHADLSDSKHS